MSRGVRAALMVLALLAGTFVVAPAAQAADNNVSVTVYCERNVSSGNYWVKSKAVNVNNRWDGWRCARANGSLSGVDMALACRQQFGPQARAVVVNQTWSGWRCRV